MGIRINIGNLKLGSYNKNWLRYWTTSAGIALKAKMVGWWQDKGTYWEDNLSSGQVRESFTQNSLSGQIFPGRSISYDATKTQYSYVADNGTLDPGAQSLSLSFDTYFDNTGAGAQKGVVGKAIYGGPIGRWGFILYNNKIAFNVYSTGGNVLVYSNNVVSTGQWYNIIGIINFVDNKIHLYINGVEQGTGTSFTGTITALANQYKFNIGCDSANTTGAPQDYMSGKIRDVRLFKNKVLSSIEITTLQIGGFVSGFTEWWMMEDNAARCHSARLNGRYLTNVNFDATSYYTGNWINFYNKYGYAEVVTYGQVPPDMISETPVDDCYGNDLVFVGQAKYNLSESGVALIMPFESNIINACSLITLNLWFSGIIPQSINIADIAPYQGARQFYDPERGLIIIKKGQWLTSIEEIMLLRYLRITNQSHDYIAESDSLFALFTDTQNDKILSKYDNTIRLLKNAGIWDKSDTIQFYGGLTKDNSKLDAKGVLIVSVGEDIANNHDEDGWVATYIKTGFNPSTGGNKYTQNSAHLVMYSAVKRREAENYIMGCNDGTNYAQVAFCQNGLTNPQIRFNSSVGIETTGTGTEGKFNLINRLNTAIVTNSDGVEYTHTQASAGIPNKEIYVNLYNNNGTEAGRYGKKISFFGAGESLTSAERSLYYSIIDNHFRSLYIGDEERIYENADFYYKESIYHAFCQLGNKVVACNSDTIYLSEDCGLTYSHQLTDLTGDLPTSYIKFAHLFVNGNILWGTAKKLYLSTDNLATKTEITMTWNGAPYTPDAASTGNFAHIFHHQQSWIIGGQEILVWGNYQNNGGCGAVCVYYSTDNGVHVKVAYMFGQNPYWTSTPGIGGGVLFGDPLNPIICRHVHSLTYNPDDGYYYMNTGDDYITRDEQHIMRGAYDIDTDVWIWTTLWSATVGDARQINQMSIYDNLFYYSSETLTIPGLWKCAIDDIADFSKHILDVDMVGLMGCFAKHNNKTIYSIPDYTENKRLGVDNNIHVLNYTDVENMMSITREPNDYGWFLLEGVYTSVAQMYKCKTLSIFLKPKW